MNQDFEIRKIETENLNAIELEELIEEPDVEDDGDFGASLVW